MLQPHRTLYSSCPLAWHSTHCPGTPGSSRHGAANTRVSPVLDEVSLLLSQPCPAWGPAGSRVSHSPATSAKLRDPSSRQGTPTAQGEGCSGQSVSGPTQPRGSTPASRPRRCRLVPGPQPAAASPRPSVGTRSPPRASRGTRSPHACPGHTDTPTRITHGPTDG